jgi:4-carboxymuconolactone decarboxylase
MAGGIASKHWRGQLCPDRGCALGSIATLVTTAAAGQDDTRRSSAKEDAMPERSELYQKGMAKRRQLMGDAAVEAGSKGVYSDPVMQKFLDVAVENVFGNLWTRPGLDDKTRALICVISDTCTGREPELELHLRMALRQGWTEDELIEVMLHLSGYIGVPIIRESMMVASRIFKEHRAETGRS